MTLKIPIKNRYVVSLILGGFALVIVLIFGAIFHTQFTEWEEKSLDYRFRLRKPIALYPKITTIGIDDSSLSEIGGWPWKRSVHARMIRLLKSLGVTVVYLDITFATRTKEEEDRQLIEAIQDANNVVLSAGFVLIDHPCFTEQEYDRFFEKFPGAEDLLRSFATKKGSRTCIAVNDIMADEQASDSIDDEVFWELLRYDEFVYASDEERSRAETMLKTFPYPFNIWKIDQFPYANRVAAPIEELSHAAVGLGHISGTPDPDGVYRRVPLFIRAKEQVYPSLALATVLYYLQVKPGDVRIIPGQHILLKNAKFPEADRPRDIIIPIDWKLRLRVNFPRSWKSLRPHAYADILKAEHDPELAEKLRKKFEGHIVTIGFLSTSTGDIGPTPLETSFFLALMHPTVVNMILTENFLYDMGWSVNIGIALLLVAFIAIISPRLSPLYFTLAWFGTFIAYIAFATTLFIVSGVILKLIDPVLPALILEYTLITAYWFATEERERRQLRSAFKTYVSRQMLGQILDNPQGLALTGQRKELTIMFSDVRKFSTLSDKIEPEVIHRLLNMYFSQMTRIAFEYDGFVDKFIGDGLLCFFGDPIFHPDHAQRAVRAAIKMQKAVRAIGPQIEEELDLKPIVIRIGINTGPVIVGNMGSEERMEYTVLGSDVNLAQRLEASATPGQIMISEKTYNLVKDEIDTREIGKINVKGFEHSVQVYEVNLPFE